MNDKKLPPPPVLPPRYQKVKEDFCLFHKGNLKDEIEEAFKSIQSIRTINYSL